MSALPLHIWTIILSLRDFSWVAERTNSSDAIGVIAYGLVFAFIESILLFIGVVMLGFLVSAKWEEKKRVTLMSTLVIVLSLWSIFNQTYFLRAMSPSAALAELVIMTGRPLVALYALAFFFVTLSIIVPTYLVLRSDKVRKIMQEGMDRLSLLMTLYLVFDAAALVIVIIRNLRG